jgi:hypothetical protein
VENRVKRALAFGLIAVGVSALVGLIGGWIAAPGDARAVWLGAGIAFLVQLVLFVAFFVFAFARQPLLAHGRGMLGRLLAVGVVALFGVPAAGVAAAPLLFSLVAVLFLTTLVEPLLISYPADR